MVTYIINEIFYSLQGEGVRAGTPNVFIRFAGCNLTCKTETHGFDCDTDFTGGRSIDRADLVLEMLALVPRATANDRATFEQVGVIFTGGEPGLQLDAALLEAVRVQGFLTVIETNGTVDLTPIAGLLDWITVSPKVADHALKQLTANEVKYVRHAGQAIPKTRVGNRDGRAFYKLISPAWGPEGVSRETLDWCIRLCKEHPPWRLSCQQQKWWRVR